MGHIRTIENKYKVYILTEDHKPPHVHVYYPRKHNWEAHAKVYLATGQVHFSKGFSQKAIKVIENFVNENRGDLFEEWCEVHGEDGIDDQF